MIHPGALVKPVVTRFSKFVFAYQNSQNYRYRNSLTDHLRENMKMYVKANHWVDILLYSTNVVFITACVRIFHKYLQK